MQETKKTAVILEKIFWVFLFVNPLLDIFNGFYINSVMNVNILDIEFISSLGVTPSLAVRLVFLVVFVLYILIVRDLRSILTAVPIGLAWVLSLLSEYRLFGQISPFLDAQYMARFCYNIALLMVYSRVYANRWGEDKATLLASLRTAALCTLTVLSIAVLVPAIFGLGYSTYADMLGYRGNRGFFYAGNDITAILTILVPIAIASAMQSGRFRSAVFPAAAAGLAANALMVIGSKTAFIAFGVSYAAMLIAGIVFSRREKNKDLLRGYLWVLLITAVIFLIINIISVAQQVGKLYGESFRFADLFEFSILKTILESFGATGEILEEDGLEMALLNGRQLKLREQLGLYRSGGILTLLFGIGRGSQESIIEMDLFEVLCYYGVFGLVTMMWLYVKLAIEFFIRFFRKVDTFSIALFLALALTVGYLVIAGHVLFSVTSGFYLVFVILFSRVYFAEEPKEILLWKRS